MRISNFRDYTINNWDLFARVDVETGLLFWKNKSTKSISKKLGGCWFFLDNGKHTPGLKCEELERAYKAQNVKLDIYQ